MAIGIKTTKDIEIPKNCFSTNIEFFKKLEGGEGGNLLWYLATSFHAFT